MRHGGDIYRNRVELDYSVNISPLGIPETVKEAMREAIDECAAYPDMEAAGLRQAIGVEFGVPKEWILCGNGASELFMAIARAFNPARVLIPEPSFSGYERAAASVGAEIRYFGTREEDNFALTEKFKDALKDDVDMVFLANPNNPVGNLTDAGLLTEILKICQDKRIRVVLDECFLEFTEDEKKLSFRDRLADLDNLIIVRAFTKIYAVPGLRLGYLFAADDGVRESIAAQLPEWNVSVFAQKAGEAACHESSFRAETARLVQAERPRLKERLKALGIRVFPSEANYLFLKTELPLYEELLKRGILIRDCSNYPGLRKGFYRIAVKRREENERLLEQIRGIIESQGGKVHEGN